VDTSVFGGVHDEEFQDASKRFFKLVQEGRFIAVISRVTVDEISGAPEKVRQILADLADDCLEIYEFTEEASQLAKAYIDAEALGKASFEDAMHVAIATVLNVDLILSWNFKHIVNYNRIMKFNSVNLANGYRMVEIRSPLEIGNDD
jgi:predicted nucleic acid-binding protein